MAYVSNEKINAIRSKANIVDVIGNYISLTKKGKNYACVCPFHDDHSPSMIVSEEKQIYKCFSCNAAGNVFTFIQKYENVPFLEAVQMVGKLVGETDIEDFSPSVKVNKEEYEIMNFACKFFQNNLKTEIGMKAISYLKDRGISENMINEFQIGLALDSYDSLFKVLQRKGYGIDKISSLGLINIGTNYITDTFSNRIIFPLCDKEGKVVAFSGRIYNNEKELAKYVNSKETIIFKKGEMLYNYHNAKEEAKKQGFIIVVEGYMDAIRLSSSGIKNVIALMGTSMTSQHIKLLKRLNVQVFLCLDNDEAGQNAMINNGDLLLKDDVDVRIIKMSGAKDPDEYILKNGIEKFRQYLKSPYKYYEYKFEIMKSNKDLSDSEDLANYINDVISNLNNISDDILKEITINKISKEYGISDVILRNKIIKQPKKQKVKSVSKSSKKKSQYNIVMEKILYYMMNDKNYILLYNNQLGYFDEPNYRKLANEICYYEEINKTINVADFISYISQDDKLNSLAMEIVNEFSDQELEDEYFEEYIKAANKLTIDKEIRELKEMLKKELDINKKIEITTRITELKKRECRR